MYIFGRILFDLATLWIEEGILQSLTISMASGGSVWQRNLARMTSNERDASCNLRTHALEGLNNACAIYARAFCDSRHGKFETATDDIVNSCMDFFCPFLSVQAIKY